jgi:hypothetical protein
VGPSVVLNDVEKRKFLDLPGLELRPLGCPALSQLLYRLSYPGSTFPIRINLEIWILWTDGRTLR